MTTININNPQKFITAGKAEFTIKNTNSGNKFQYRVTKKDNIYFINIRSDSHKNWIYAGFLNEKFQFIKGKKGQLNINDLAIKGLLYAIKHTTPLPEPMLMHHHGRCACCGKKLTDDKSIEMGYGPICIKWIMK